MANVQYSGVRESRPGRVNDLGTTGKEVEENYKKGCLKRADRSFAQGLQCQQINSMAALMSLEDSVFVSHSPQGCVGCTIMAVDMYRFIHKQIHIKKRKSSKRRKSGKSVCTDHCQLCGSAGDGAYAASDRCKCELYSVLQLT